MDPRIRIRTKISWIRKTKYQCWESGSVGHDILRTLLRKEESNFEGAFKHENNLRMSPMSIQNNKKSTYDLADFFPTRKRVCKVIPLSQKFNASRLCSNQCCGSMTFWCESGSADPCLWLMDPDPHFHHWPSRRQQKNEIKKKSFSAYYFLKDH